jgi:hypothetical protein
VIERRAATDGHVAVTFRLPADHPAAPIGVAGEFNDWDWERAPFTNVDDHLEVTIVVRPGRYQFRYRSADDRWFNDDGADDYVSNEFGGVNCIVHV